MMRSNPEATAKFDDAFAKLQTKQAGGKAGIDIDALKALVVSDWDSAHDFVIIHCLLAKQNPAQLQAAMIVASMFRVLRNDDELVRQVTAVAKSMGQTAVLERLQILSK